MINQIQLFSSFWMMAVIWFVQIVHYPLFYLIPDSARIIYAKKHQYLISWVVVIPMLIEAFTIFWIDYEENKTVWIACIICLTIIWLSTFLLQVPCHNLLLVNPTDKTITKLVNLFIN